MSYPPAATVPPKPWHRYKRSIIWALVLTAIGLPLMLTGFLAWPHAIVIGCIIVALDKIASQGRGFFPEAWPHPPVRFRSGARTEVAQLAWGTVTRDGDVSEKVLLRVRALARQTLADHGVEWSGAPGEPMVPAGLARELLGSEALTTLTTTAKVRPRALENVVSRLEQLRKVPRRT